MGLRLACILWCVVACIAACGDVERGLPASAFAPSAAPPSQAVSGLAPVTASPLPVPLEPETVGATTIVAFEEAFEGVFLFGVGADPASFLSNFSGTGGGIAPIPVVLRPVDGLLEIRALDVASGTPVEGDDGHVESYPMTVRDDGRWAVDFAQPARTLEIQLWGDCRFGLTPSLPEAPPRYADGLLTWPTVDTIEASRGCPGWLSNQDPSLHVRFLRHTSASAGFVAREAEAKSPFGFFMEEDPTGRALLSRLPLGPDTPNGSVTYYLAGDWPEAYVPAAIASFEAWNDTLEDAFGRRPFAVEMAPTDMIAWDPRYHVVLWDGADDSGGAIAPFATDPATGEVVQAFVVMWFGSIGQIVGRYVDFFDRHPEVIDGLDPSLALDAHRHAVRPMPHEASFAARTVAGPAAPARVLRQRSFHERRLSEASVMRTVASLYRDLSADEIAAIIVQDYLIHEIGHNLGLRHNFVASVDRNRLVEADTATSVMDYVVGQMVPGSYDAQAMRYGYGDGAEDEDFLYCTDEHLEADPACAQWDFGHPVAYWLDALKRLLEAYPPDVSTGRLEQDREVGDWHGMFRRVRQFMNTDHEAWDGPDTRRSVYEELLNLVICDTAEGEACAVHPYFRQEFALYLLYTRHAVDAYWEPGAPTVWLDFPRLNAGQRAQLWDSFYSLIVNEGAPFALKATIIDKLPTAAVDGAGALLDTLAEHFAGLSAPSEEEQALRQRIVAAQNQ